MSVLATHLSPEHSFSKLSKSSITLLEGLGVEGDCHSGKTVQHIYNIKKEKREEVAPSPNLRQVHLIQAGLFDEEGVHAKSWWGTRRLRAGQMGENITTIGIELLSLSEGAKLHFISSRAEEHCVRQILTIHGQVLILLMVVAVASAMIITSARTGIAMTSVLIATVLVLRFVHATSSTEEREEDTVATVILTGLRKPCQKINQRFGYKAKNGLREKFVIKDEAGKEISYKAGVMGIVAVGGVVRPGMTVVVESPEVFIPLPPI